MKAQEVSVAGLNNMLFSIVSIQPAEIDKIMRLGYLIDDGLLVRPRFPAFVG